MTQLIAATSRFSGPYIEALPNHDKCLEKRRKGKGEKKKKKKGKKKKEKKMQ